MTSTFAVELLGSTPHHEAELAGVAFLARYTGRTFEGLARIDRGIPIRQLRS